MISISVMTHPIRLNLAKQVMNCIPKSFNPKLFIDTDTKGIWANAMNAWRAYNPDYHYHMVLQDDIVFCSDFFETLISILEIAYKINPEHSISFCDNLASKTKLARQAGYPWFLTNQARHAQALVQPIYQIEDFIQYSERHVRPEFYHDDGRLEIYMVKHNKHILHTVPSLVEHNDQGSVKRALSGKLRKDNQRKKGYTSSWFIGEDGKASDIDWEGKVAGFSESLGQVHRWAIGEIDVWPHLKQMNKPIFQFPTSHLPYDEVMKDALIERGVYDSTE